MSDPLAFLWPSVDTPEPRFTAGRIASWPADAVRQLDGLGILRRTDNAVHVVCPGCSEGHVEEVVPQTGPDGHTRFFIPCPESLRVEVPETLLLQWTIDFDALATVLAGALALKGHPKTVVPGRLWRLGKTPWQGANREVLFARGLGWPDSLAVACHVGPNGRPVILVAQQAPPDAVWMGRPPAAIVLAQVATLGEDGIEIDAVDVAARVNEADQRVASVMGLPVTAAEQKRAIRQQVRAEVKAHLEDDVLVAAYKECSSYRGAADALTRQLGKMISKDKIRRAVLRAGGLGEVAQTADSSSVRRTVASQRRDGRKIIRKSP